MPPPDALEGLTAPPVEAVERFRRDLTGLTGVAPTADKKLGIAISGGPDSVALLLLAAAAWPKAVLGVTVNHGLRREAAAEAQAVGRWCREVGVPHEILDIPEGILSDAANLQEQARDRRYLLLHFWAGSDTLANARPWRVEWLATAHQRDDVAESFLMRARRGAGVGGLAAMPAARPLDDWVESPLLIRPLLTWTRAELADIVRRAGIVAVDDPSNVHPRFDRSRIRALLDRERDLPRDRLALSAQNLRHAEDALEWITQREWDARHEVVDYETIWVDPSNLPYELRRRMARRAIDHVRFEVGARGDWRGTGLDRLVAALDSRQAATLAGVAAKPGERWRFRPAPPRRST